MTERQDKVWYACYGSNLLEERFLCYIQGGQPKGANTIYNGCIDKSSPVNKEEIYINAELYFARSSKNWDNGGVSFIKTKFEPQVQTLGRMYLITKQQLIDIARQETNTASPLEINFEKAIEKGFVIYKPHSWYGNLIYLGTQDDFPIFTLTNEQNYQPEAKPSAGYLITIAKGIKETYNLTQIEMVEYFMEKAGVKGNYRKQDLIEVLSRIDK